MSDQENGVPEREIPIMGQMVDRTSRFSKEVLATMISLASAAFGVVAALAWNSAIQAVLQHLIKADNTRISVLFIYAFVITLIGVVVIVTLGRLAARLSAEPVEFKYPGVPKS
jgi:sorbitol-specific phosphotransferase system component IIBC